MIKYVYHLGIYRAEMTNRHMFTWTRLQYHLETYFISCRIRQTVNHREIVMDIFQKRAPLNLDRFRPKWTVDNNIQKLTQVILMFKNN